MRVLRLISYEARIIFGFPVVLPTLLLPTYALIQWFIWSRSMDPPQLSAILRGFELMLPLSTATAAAHLMVVDKEERFHELRVTYPEPFWFVPVLRTSGALGLGGISAILGMVLFRFAFGPYAAIDQVLPALPPTLFLLGLSLFVSHMGANYWASSGTVVGIWFFSLFTRGRVLPLFYLFDRSWPVDTVSYLENRWALAGMGAVLLVANALLAASWTRTIVDRKDRPPDSTNAR